MNGLASGVHHTTPLLRPLHPQALPLSDTTAEAVAKAFISVRVAHFGCPQQIATDQGRQFKACLFKTMATITDPF